MQIRKSVIFACAALALLQPLSQSSALANPVVQLDIGDLKIEQQYGSFIKFDVKDGKPIQVTDRGGAYWPPIATDSQGVFYIGDKILSADTGRLVKDEHRPDLVILGSHYRIEPNASGKAFRIARGKQMCTLKLDQLGIHANDARAIELLKNTSVRFVDSSGPLIALVTLLGDRPSDTRYRTVSIAPGSCRIDASADLGNPDYLVELGWSPQGHWWMAGSTENTLLRSNDGAHWSAMKLPDNMSELISAYVADDRHIWLAATDSTLALDAGPLVVYSQDGGKSWVPLKWGDPLIKEIPPFWLEGQMRSRGKEIN